MTDKGNGSTPLEFFLWRREDKSNPISAEKTVQGSDGDSNLVGDALRVFNSRTRTVRRSSGGVSVAEPYQIVFLDPTTPDSHKPEVHIKVRFKDFKVTRAGEISTDELTTHTKVVAPSELGEAFSYDLEKKEAQSYVVDFGQGIVPVHIVDFRLEASGAMMAYFVESDDLQRLLGRDASGAVPVQLYRVDRDVIRLAQAKRAQGGKSEWDHARENYLQLKRQGVAVIPPSLSYGKPVPLASGRTPQEARTLLAKVITLKAQPEAEPVGRRNADTGEMVPFGVFEG